VATHIGDLRVPNWNNTARGPSKPHKELSCSSRVLSRDIVLKGMMGRSVRDGRALGWSCSGVVARSK
jgi:hypothetical protein